MKKFGGYLITIVLFLGMAVYGQTVDTRPRVVTAPANTPTPQVSPTPEEKPLETPTPTPAPTPPTETPAVTPQTTKTPDPNEVIEDNEILKVETNLVTIPVSVVDRQGRFISGIVQDDFEIYEDGVKQEIAYFANVEKPFTIFLVLDMSPSTKFKTIEIQDAAIAFTKMLRPDDRMMIISFDGQIHVLSEPTSDQNQMREAILRSQLGTSTSLYEAVDYVVKKRVPQIPGRKAIVLFTDGVDTSNPRRMTFDGTLRDAEKGEATIYPIQYNTFNDLEDRNNPKPTKTPAGIPEIISNSKKPVYRGSIGSSPEEYRIGGLYLRELSTKTGGRVYQAENSETLKTAFTGIAADLRNQYGLGYYPPNVGEIGQRKAIKIRVHRPNLVVRARNSYIVGEEKKP